MTRANRIAFILISATIVFTTLAYGTVHQPILALFYVLTAALLILWAIDGLTSGKLRFSTDTLQLPLALAAVYGFVQIIPFGSFGDIAGLSGVPNTISHDSFATKVTTLHFIALLIFLCVTLTMLDSATRLRRFASHISVFGVAFAFFAILQGVLSPGKIFGIYEAMNPYGTFVNRHNFAAFMEMTIALPLGMLFVGSVEKDKRLLYVTGIALMGVALLLSGSRGGFVALLAEICLILLITAGGEKFKKKAVLIRAGFAVLLVGAIVVGSFYIGGESSLTRFAETANSEDITTNRSYIWQVTSDVIKNNQPFGAGFGAFGVAFTPYDNRSGLERVEQSHNDYLQVVADAGIPGAIIGLLFLYLLFTSARKAINVENLYRRGVAVGALAGCFAVLVHSLFDFVLHTTAISILFLSLIALLIACKNDFSDDLRDVRNGQRRRSKKYGSAVVGHIEEYRQINQSN